MGFGFGIGCGSDRDSDSDTDSDTDRDTVKDHKQGRCLGMVEELMFVFFFLVVVACQA